MKKTAQKKTSGSSHQSSEEKLVDEEKKDVNNLVDGDKKPSETELPNHPQQQDKPKLEPPKHKDHGQFNGFLVEEAREIAPPEPSSWWTKEISFKTFILSHLAILIVGLSAIGALAYYLNKDKQLYLYHQSGPVTKEPISFNLDINNPDDNLLVYEKSLVVSGKTSPNAVVVISTNSEDYPIEVGDKGDFSRVISLNQGLNEITVNAFDSQGDNKTVIRSVYYTEEKLEQ